VGVVLAALLAAGVALSRATVSHRAGEHEGAATGEVLVGEEVVFVLLTSAGGHDSLDRARIVAERLQNVKEVDLVPDRVEIQEVKGGQAVYVGDSLVVTITTSEAAAHASTPPILAAVWQDRLRRALRPAEAAETAAETAESESTPSDGGEAPAPSSGEAAAPTPVVTATAAEVDWKGTKQKWVPIFSLEREGIRVGAAQVAGPASQVDQVRGVAQFRLDFRGFARVYAYVPVSTISVTKLDRVQGVSVWAVGDIKLVGF
jgi:hypothetical protein